MKKMNLQYHIFCSKIFYNCDISQIKDGYHVDKNELKTYFANSEDSHCFLFSSRKGKHIKYH